MSKPAPTRYDCRPARCVIFGSVAPLRTTLGEDLPCGFDRFEHAETIAKHGFLLEIDAIVSDILMPGPTGLEILEALHDRPGFPPMILITGSADEGTYAQTQRAGAAAVLEKPFGVDKLLAKLHEIAPCPRDKERGK